MARKRWEAQTDVTPELVQAREKRKWQINLRRYVIEQSPCPMYVPYFGLDIKNLRNWFESQFTGNLTWNNFGDAWQFSHIIPLSYFDQTSDDDLRLCWSFINLRVDPTIPMTPDDYRLDIVGAKQYLTSLYEKTMHPLVKQIEERLSRVEEKELEKAQPQLQFLTEHKDYLNEIIDYTAFEFELLNHGKSTGEINKEVALLKKNV